MLMQPNTRRNFLQLAAKAGVTVSGAGLVMGALSVPAFAQGPDFTMKQLMMPMPLKDLPIGKDDAPITVIEYASMTCPHCAEFQKVTFPKLKSDYLDTGKARYILREFPLDPLATAAFMVARYAGDDKRNAVVDLLFANQDKWVYVDKQVDGMTKLLTQAGITKDQIDKCLADKQLYDNVNKMRDIGADTFKIDSTPTFFINGRRHEGDFAPADLPKLIVA